MNINKLLSDLISPKGNKEYAYKMGYDRQKNGANTTNCHFMIFSSPENTRAWEKGQRDAKIVEGEKTKEKFNKEYEQCLKQGERYIKTGNINAFRKG